MRLRDEWVRDHFVAPAGPQMTPLSFICDGKPSSEFLGSWTRRVKEQRFGAAGVHRCITWTDPATGLEVAAEAVDYRDLPATEWLLRFTNKGSKDTPIIEAVRPLDVHFASAPQQGFILHHSLGDANSAGSFAPVDEVIKPDSRAEFAYSPGGGRSSNAHMPYFNVDCHGSGVVVAIGWAGEWHSSFEQLQAGDLRASADQQLTHFRLHPGESVRTPRILLTFWKGPDDLRGNNLFRQVVLAHYVPRRDGRPVFPPICASVNETAPDGTYEKPHVEAAPVFSQGGIEVFWFDMDPQHWYGDFSAATGTWEPDPKRLPNGLKPLGDAAHKAGLGFLLWFEPERAHAGTKIDRIHPEYLTKLPGSEDRLYRFDDATARQWLLDYIDVQVSDARLDWIRWDFNMEPLAYWRSQDAPDRQGITEMRHVEGLYAMWQELGRRHPGILIDICASGGRRLDFETCSYGAPLWHSDMQCGGAHPAADQLQNAGLWRWVPMHGCGDFELEPNYGFRSTMTAGNILAASRNGHFAAVQPACVPEIRKTVAIYQKLRPYMLGDFYPLFPHVPSEEAWFGYQFHRPGSGDGMAMVFRRAASKLDSRPIALRGLDESKRYEVTFEDTPDKRTVTGKELMNFEVKLPRPASSAILYYHPL
jgi:alpha-galactosidase